MNEYLLLMYQNAPDRAMVKDAQLWNDYFTSLRASGRFDGGSAIGPGERHQKDHGLTICESDLSGFIRVRAEDMIDARQFLIGNPVFEAGGTVEIRELPRS